MVDLHCPLCRATIKSTEFTLTKATKEQVDDGVLTMWIDTREAFLEKLRGHVSSKAGMKGKSKLARSVNNALGNAFVEAQLERQATELMSSKCVYNIDDDTLYVKYTPLRKIVEHTYEYLDKKQLKHDLQGTEQVSILDLAMHDPHIYHLIQYHYGNVEDGMRDVGILQEKRRRKKKNVN